MSIMSIGAAGMRAAEARFETAATRITHAGAGLGDAAQPDAEIDMATEMVSMMLATYDFKASAKIVEVGRDMSRTVLDILA
jgi:flagellar basal body rod protein FlgC